jgi:hypothetical protein
MSACVDTLDDLIGFPLDDEDGLPEPERPDSPQTRAGV